MNKQSATKNRKHLFLALLTVSLSIACARGTNESNPAGSASANAAATVSVPVKEGVEEQVEPRISAANLDDKLDELEKQIGATH